MWDRVLRTCGFAVALMVSFCLAAAAEPGAVLVKARLASIEILSSPKGDMNPGEIVRHKLKIEENLIGHTDETSFTFTANRVGEPMPGYEYFLIEKPSPTGLVTMWWDFAHHGLCIDRQRSSRFGIDYNAIQRVQRRYPCTQ